MEAKNVMITLGSSHDIDNIVGKATLQGDFVMTPSQVLSPIFIKKDKSFELVGLEVVLDQRSIKNK